MIYTFYSYKGGVGRSMALANIAELFFKQGLRVLVIDWDLEAPGLEHYFPVDKEAVLEQPGVMDILLNYKLKMAQEIDEEQPLQLEDPKTFSINIYPNESKGELRLITAGQRKNRFKDYARSVLSFDWKDFYENWEGERFFELFRQQIEKMSDVVLIDSRTGLTEMGGVCTYHLADAVILFCSANEQSIEGTLQMIRDFSRDEVLKFRNNRQLKTLVVPSRVEKTSELEDLNAFRKSFSASFSSYIPKELINNEKLFEQVEIQYLPKYSFKEIVAVNQTQDSLLYAPELKDVYYRLYENLVKLAPSDSPIRNQKFDKRIEVFISYATEDYDIAKKLYDDLKTAGIEPWLDREDLLPGQNWKTTISQIIRNCRYFLLLISSNSLSKKGYLQREQKIALEVLDESPEIFIVPALLDNTEPLEEKLKNLHWADFSEYENGFQQIMKVFRRFGKKNQDDSEKNKNAISKLTLKADITNIHVSWKHKIHEIMGIDSHDDIFDNDNIPQKVFSIELLEEPLILKKEKDKLIVNINRKGIEYAVYNNRGKNELCKKCFNKQPHIVEFAKDIDKAVHNFFLGKSDTNEIEIILKELPLRWSSGGVFCVVEYDNRKWTPFFFRDIKPFGWNIPLGASENLQEVNQPWNVLWRNFMEEFIILTEAPKSDSQIKVRKPVFPKINELTLPYKAAFNIMNKHLELRKKFDNLDLIISDEDLIYYDVIETNTVLNIVSDFSSSQAQNILVAINPFELGIEAVAIIKCKLNKNDYILDGEIMEPKGGSRELVRLPIALISHDYLKEAFNKDSFKLEYDGLSQASIKRNDIPQDEIIMFGWDISNRLAILENSKAGIGTEFERYKKWKENFGIHFMNNGLNQFNQGLGLFTPASAKISSYYFAQKQG